MESICGLPSMQQIYEDSHRGGDPTYFTSLLLEDDLYGTSAYPVILDNEDMQTATPYPYEESSSPYTNASDSSGSTYVACQSSPLNHSSSDYSGQSSPLLIPKQEIEDSPSPMLLSAQQYHYCQIPKVEQSCTPTPQTVDSETDWRHMPLSQWSKAAWNRCLLDFINFMDQQERLRWGHSYVHTWFRGENFIKRSPVKVYHMSRTELWTADCIYGHRLQLWMCREMGLPLPKVSQKQRKRQLKPPKRRRVLSDQTMDLDLEDLDKSCSHAERKRTSPRDQILLHIFCLDLLCHPYYNRVVQWKDKSRLIFTVLNSAQMAKLWQQVKENETSDYENFARGIRYSRSRGYFQPLRKQQKKVYQFSIKAIEEYRHKTSRNPLDCFTKLYQ